LLVADRTLPLGYKLQRERFSRPAIKTEDPVGFGDHMPAFDIANLAAALPPLANVLAVEWGCQLGHLIGREPSAR
jgi:hypothetical protein